MTRALIWTAVSSKPQTERDSLQDQERDARALCDERGWDVVEVLTVPGQSREVIEFSEAAADMEAYRQLRLHLRARDCDILVCRGLDRLGRTTALVHQVVAYCQQSGVQIHPLTMPLTGNPTADNFLIAIGGAVAANELTEFRRRSRDGMDGRARRGLPVGSRLPFPYYRALDASKDRPSGPALLDPTRAAALHDCLALLRSGATIADCARHLNAVGCLTSSDNPWRCETLARVLRNPFLAGHVVRHRLRSGHLALGEPQRVRLPRERWIIAEGQHEPVFTPDEWAELQSLIPLRHSGRPPGSSNAIWCGLLRCGYCGAPMYAFGGERHGQTPYITYLCSNYIANRQREHTNAIAQSAVNRQVIPLLQALLADATEAEGNMPAAAPDVGPDLEAIAQREKRLILLYETGRITLADYDDRLRSLQADRQVLLNRVAEAQAARAAWERGLTSHKSLAELLPDLPRLFVESPTRDLNRILRALLPPLVVKDKQVIGVLENR